MSTDSSTSPDIGLVLNGRYRVLELIARGGMATVYRGFDERLHRDVALKIMHPHLADSPEFVSRFSREARSAARLTHPHVVNVYDQGEDQGRVYLAMQLVDGITLRDELRREKSLTVRRALRVGHDVLSALDAAHRSGIIHRDVKPENVLVNSENEIMVADFGLARAVGSATTSATGTMLGTVAYVSPEVVTRGVSDARSDLYSWGIMMFEMLTGRTPFRGDSAVHIAYQHAHEDIPAPSRFAPGIPASVDAVVTWAASRLPTSRPARAHEVLVALDDALSNLTAEQLNYRAPLGLAAVELENETQAVPVLTRDLEADASLAKADSEDQRGSVPPEAPVQSGLTAFLTRTGFTGRDHGSEDQPRSLTLTGGVAAPKSFDLGAPDDRDSDSNEAVRHVSRPARLKTSGRHASSQPKSDFPKLVAGVLGMALLATVLYGASVWYSADGPGADRTVPLVAGATLKDAEAAITSEGLKVDTQEAFSDSVPSGHVISSEPGTGQILKKGETIHLIVSEGVEQISVPAVVGTTSDQAKKALTDAGFTVTEKHDYSASVPAGSIISMSPDGKTLAKGSAIEVTISDGPKPVAVPNVANQPKAAAIQAIQNTGLKADVKESFSSSIPVGNVIEQSPTVGESLLPGATVTITVSRGPDLVDVPNVFAKSETDARKTLEAAGFQVSVVYERGTAVFGLVSQQSQPAGTKAARGSTITLTVY